MYVCVCARTWPNINQVFLCLEFCGPLSWNHAITSITAPLSLNLNVLRREEKKRNTNNKLKSLTCFVRSFMFSLLFFFFFLEITRLNESEKKQFFLDIKWCFAYCMTLFFYAVIMFQKKNILHGNFAMVFSEE